MKKLLILLTLLFYTCRDTTTLIDIQGFWKVTTYNKIFNNETKTYFCEIGHEDFLVWDKDVEYLPPFKYSIKNDSLTLILVKHKNNNYQDILLDSLVQGKLSFISQDTFYSIKNDKISNYTRSTYNDFFIITRQYWINDSIL